MMYSWLGSPENYPLNVLARKLVLAPPSIRAIMEQLADSEVIAEFFALVKEYLPEHEVALMTMSHSDRIFRFCQEFEQKYFPLYEGIFDMGYDTTEGYHSIMHDIPIARSGITYEEYEDLDSMRPGFVMLEALVTSPFWSDQKEMVALREKVAGWTSMRLVRRIPSSGWSPEQLESFLRGTEYSVVAGFARWLHRQTGSPWLDMSWEDEGYGDLAWEKELVDYMTEQWPITEAFFTEVTDLAAKLEADPGLLRDIVRHIEGKAAQWPLIPDNEPKTLMEVFSDDDPDRIRIRI